MAAGGRNNVTQNRSPFVKDTWTREFCCLPYSFTVSTPTPSILAMLTSAGIGKKKIAFHQTDSHALVLSKLEKAYPKLKNIGGFVLMRSKDGGSQRPLSQISTNWYDVKNLRKRNITGHGTIYIKTLQKDLSLSSVTEKEIDSLCRDENARDKSGPPIKCNLCGSVVALNKFEKHKLSCRKRKLDTSSDDEDLKHSPFTAREPLPLTIKDDNLPLTTDKDESIDDAQENSEAEIVVIEESKIGKEVRKIINYFEAHVQVQNPVEMLRYLQKQLIHGRPLGITDESDIIDGETNHIFVNRNDVLTDGLEEIRDLYDPMLTLNVQFHGEVAKDFGGPRKEFFSIILRSIKEKFFDNGIIPDNDDYETVGLILGMSMLQNGVIPCFLKEDVIEDLFVKNSMAHSINKLRVGLSKVGIYQVGKKFETFRHIFRSSTMKTLSMRSVINILKPKFSEEGSNSRIKENAMYSLFVKYLREVASGRRKVVTLNHILVFTTGMEEEPLLGYEVQPSIHFTVSEHMLPTANVCVNRMTLPIIEDEDLKKDQNRLFNLYDYAFANTYFGLE